MVLLNKRIHILWKEPEHFGLVLMFLVITGCCYRHCRSLDHPHAICGPKLSYSPTSVLATWALRYILVLTP
ncbi:unnamed protein product [Prunus armeniaca]